MFRNVEELSRRILADAREEARVAALPIDPGDYEPDWPPLFRFLAVNSDGDTLIACRTDGTADGDDDEHTVIIARHPNQQARTYPSGYTFSSNGTVRTPTAGDPQTLEPPYTAKGGSAAGDLLVCIEVESTGLTYGENDAPVRYIEIGIRQWTEVCT